MDMGDIIIPDATQIDAVLQIHCGQDFPECDLRVTKDAKFETRTVQKALPSGEIVTAQQEVCTEDPILEGFGSSEIIDSDGDEFKLSALESLCKAAPGMSTWMNHEMKLPDKFMGQLVDAPELVSGGPEDRVRSVRPMTKQWAGVRLRSRVEMENFPARQLYTFIQKGAHFGWSVGCQYTKYRRKTDARGAIKGYEVFEVSPVEWSVVGQPSNPASWVEVTRKMFVRKGILPANDDDPEVAYVFKHWDEFGMAAPKIRAFATEMFNTYGLVLAEPATGKRMSWPGA